MRGPCVRRVGPDTHRRTTSERFGSDGSAGRSRARRRWNPGAARYAARRVRPASLGGSGSAPTRCSRNDVSESTASQVSRGGASVSNWPRAQSWWASSASSSATIGPVSTTTVGDATMRVLGDGLVEQTPICRQIGASASEGADEVAGQPGTARWRSIRVARINAFSMISRTREDRVKLRLRASLVSVAWSSAGSLTVRRFMRGW